MLRNAYDGWPLALIHELMMHHDDPYRQAYHRHRFVVVEPDAHVDSEIDAVVVRQFVRVPM